MGHDFASLVAYLVGILNQLVGVLAVGATLLFMWGAFRYVYYQGKAKQRKTLLWSLLALFILFSVWAILRVACDSFLGNDACGTGFTNTLPTGTFQESGPYPQNAVLPF